MVSRPGKLASRAGDRTGIERKLAKYALAGGAILGVPLAANAGTVQYSGSIDQSISNGQNYTANLPGGGLFTVTASSNGLFQSVMVSGTQVTFVNDPGNYPEALSFGDLITTANATGPGGTLAGFEFMGKNYSGNWPQNGNAAYLGLSFTSSGQSYTGWAQIIASSGGVGSPESATLVDYAYQTTPGASITAGEMAYSRTVGIALFALGAAGIAVLRRRKTAN